MTWANRSFGFTAQRIWAISNQKGNHFASPSLQAIELWETTSAPRAFRVEHSRMLWHNRIKFRNDLKPKYPLRTFSFSSKYPSLQKLHLTHGNAISVMSLNSFTKNENRRRKKRFSVLTWRQKTVWHHWRLHRHIEWRAQSLAFIIFFLLTPFLFRNLSPSC